MARIYRYSLLVLLSVFTFTSCDYLNDEDVETSDDARIKTFYIAQLGTSFTVDNTNNIIYNADSLPFGTDVSNVLPTITTYSSSGIHMNSVAWASSDSLDFSSPVVCVNYASDKITTRNYTIKVLVHTVEGDDWKWKPSATMHSASVSAQTGFYFSKFSTGFELFNDGVDNKIVSSTDGVNWTSASSTNLPATFIAKKALAFKDKIYVLGEDQSLYVWADTNPSSFSLVTGVSLSNLLFDLNNKLWGVNAAGDSIASTSTGTAWSTIAKLPVGLPTSFDAVKTKNAIGAETAFLVGGTNSASSFWSTDNGTYWVNVSATKALVYTENASIVAYDNKLFVLNDTIARYSENNGLSWAKSDSVMFFPAVALRSHASMFVDNNKYLWIVGGKENGIWSSVANLAKKNEMWFAE